MKHLPKHLTPRYRYIALTIESWPDATIERGEFQQALWEATKSLLGDPGSARVDPRIMCFEFRDGMGEATVRIRSGTKADARAAIACIDQVDSHSVRITIQGVAGTIRSCEEKYLGRAPIAGDERKVVFEDSARSAVVRTPRVDIRTDAGWLGATELDIE